MNLVKPSPILNESGTLTLGSLDVPYQIKRSAKRRRTMGMRIHNQTILLLAPLKTPTKTLLEFAQSRQQWIIKQLDRQESTSALFNHFHDGQVIYVLGDAKRLFIDDSETHPPGCEVNETRLHVFIIPTLDADERHYRIWKEITTWFRHQAHDILKQRLDHWSKIMNVKYSSFQLSSAKSYWGLCTRHNQIKLNWKLVMTPLPVMDYVIIHELAHISQKNHSPRFWAIVARYVPDYKAKRKDLRDGPYTRGIKVM
ncbi:MAG: M48 family metallopeptidase [Alphaproteobacteria bacterium]|nr:M48 family metallopeptidase [Alphaproteobacteria bacterium]